MTLEELFGDEKEFQFLIGKVEQLGIIGIEAVLKTVAGAQFLIGKV